jgi:capsular polysaccharide transport system permease protein
MDANRGLFNYRQVKPLDTLHSRVLLEVIIYSFLLFLMMVLAPHLGLEYSFNNLLLVFSSLILLIITSFSIALIFMSIGGLFPESKKILQVLTKPLYFISGIFFSISDIPVQYQEIMSLNPILNLLELLREGLFNEFNAGHGDYSYALMTSMILLSFSLFLYNRSKIALLTT